MAEAVLALDAGTTSVRALIIGVNGAVLAHAREGYTLQYPAPGLVEQDAEALWTTTRGVIETALRDAKLTAGDLAAVGITSQRSCVIVWDRATGQTLAPLVSWQDLRGAARADELQREGYFVLPQTAASKVEAVLDGIDGGRDRLARGELAWGNVDTFLAWRLSDGQTFATDPSQACTTGYYDHMTGAWDPTLIELQGLTPECFPTIVDTAGELGRCATSVLGAEVLIGAIIGDQQGAAVAQGCVAPGDGKVTFGTSGTCNVHTGTQIVAAQGAYPLVLSRRAGETLYCLEGMVITAGAVFDWLANGLGLFGAPKDAAALAASVPDSHGVFVLPALQGLGSPHADPTRHALIGGLTRGATRAHVVRAAMEGVAFRVREMLDRVYADADLPRPDVVPVDGGAAANDVFLQIQADVFGRPVERMAPLEATAFGAAMLAGQSGGMWDAQAAGALRRVDRTFEPTWSADERETRFTAWQRCCRLDEAQ